MIPSIYTYAMSAAVAQSLKDYTLVNLAFLHVESDGSLRYNSDPIRPGSDPGMAEGNLDLAGSGKYIFLSIGGPGCDDDYLNIAANYDSFLYDLKKLLRSYFILGIDLALEPTSHPYSDFLPVCTQLVTDLSEAGYWVSASPCAEMNFWQSLLDNTRFPDDGSVRFFVYNLPLYRGVSYPAWVDGFTGLVPDPEYFLTAGFDGHLSHPGEVARALFDLTETYPRLFFASIWRNGNLVEAYEPAQYAEAIMAAGFQPGADVRTAAAAHVQAYRENLARHYTIPIAGATIGSPAGTA